MILETILSQDSKGIIPMNKVQRLNGCGHEALCLRYSPVPPVRVFIIRGIHVHLAWRSTCSLRVIDSDDAESKCSVERGRNGNGTRLRGGAWNGGVYEGEADGM